MSQQLTKFEQFKQRLYLWVIPILVLALLSIFLDWDGNLGFLEYIGVFLIVWYVCIWILIFKGKAFRIIELLTLVINSVIHLITTFTVTYTAAIEKHDMTGSIGYWTTLTYIYIFITIYGRVGAIYSFVLWLLTLFITLSFWDSLLGGFKSNFSQYMLANLVYIIFLFSARKLIRNYTKAEILEEMAYQDQLTGIGNRRQLYMWIESFIQKSNTNFSVIFFDIDRFKKVNDEFGHKTGDQVLVEFTTVISKVLSKEDYFGRWGGEEFVIVSKRTFEQTVQLAEKLRKNVKEHSFTEIGNLTSSFGVEKYKMGDNAETILDRADKALYKAKQEGRNRVCVYKDK
ncbi:GGDEF domain-containing protein [Bacillus luteolus]|uniref:GGDEF domain-containing protein n=1 Tax=Litchfieldia luteola TaxID=682179 RepID=A0ABR9QJC1_9BACI|nr:GGDEF domain-containing protein [Cytobacillus luteolus]MBE4908595.1 GGDEF domain-containing protein [Cytobacillus luteolus]MBP1941450.1 diguanylate cyclase (GGDEF)-like protein [Cytobacillus luteolus]